MKIEKNIPFPENGMETLTLLKNMEIGDSSIMTHQEKNRVVSYGSRFKYKFITRKTENGCYRVWLKGKPSKTTGNYTEKPEIVDGYLNSPFKIKKPA